MLYEYYVYRRKITMQFGCWLVSNKYKVLETLWTDSHLLGSWLSEPTGRRKQSVLLHGFEERKGRKNQVIILHSHDFKQRGALMYTKYVHANMYILYKHV